MSTIGSVSQMASQLVDKAPVVSPAKIEEAAKDFESLLLAQMLKSMRESSSGWLGTGEDTSSAPAMEMAEEQFAQALSSSGGLGLAKMVSASLKLRNEALDR